MLYNVYNVCHCPLTDSLTPEHEPQQARIRTNIGYCGAWAIKYKTHALFLTNRSRKLNSTAHLLDKWNFNSLQLWTRWNKSQTRLIRPAWVGCIIKTKLHIPHYNSPYKPSYTVSHSFPGCIRILELSKWSHSLVVFYGFNSKIPWLHNHFQLHIGYIALSYRSVFVFQVRTGDLAAV